YTISFNTINTINGEFTAGDNAPTNPFTNPKVYYSRINDLSAGSGLWNANATWSTVSHSGAAANNYPGESDIAIIGGQDVVSLNTYLDTPNLGSVKVATLKIAAGSTLDMGYNPSSDFGAVLNHESGNGNFRIACKRGSTNIYNPGTETFEFPKGDFSDYNQNLGTTELYTTNNVAGSTFYLPNGTTSYGNLIISPLGGSNIIFPNNDLLIYGSLTTRGQNADSWFCPSWNVDYPTNPKPRISKTITINGDLDILGGGLVWYGTTRKQTLVVHGDIVVTKDATILNFDKSVADLYIGGSLINNTVGGIAAETETKRECDFNNIPVTFFGNGNSYITNTSGTPTTRFSKLNINKASLADSVILDVSHTLITPTNDWLTINSGMLVYSRIDPSSDFTISTTTPFVITSNAGLHVEYTSVNRKILIGNANSNNGDLNLEGKLTLVNGTVNIGSSANNNNNDIEYSGSGSAMIDVQGGSLFVNGQIRRSPAAAGSVLKYRQTGGAVTVNGRNANLTNAKLEVLNAGSQFNMSDGTLTIVRGNGGTQYGDLYLRPENSEVTGGIILFSQGTNDEEHTYILESTAALHNLTIDGKNSGGVKNATVKLFLSPLILNGDLVLKNNQSILDVNENNNVNLFLNGNLENNGTYRYHKNKTTFGGNVQTITGSATTNFYNMEVAPIQSLTIVKPITVDANLTLSSGQLLAGVHNIEVKGDVENNATYDGDAVSGGLLLSGEYRQQISGTGTFGRLTIFNSYGVDLTTGITLQKNLNLTSGILYLHDNLLTLSATSIIEGSGFGPYKMIATDGVFSSMGLQKIFPPHSESEKIFDFPIGTSDKYRPVKISYTKNTQTASVRVNGINDNHPGVLDTENVLGYFWEVESKAISGFDGNLKFYYQDSDVAVTDPDT
ncbi:MAG: hypothetical protein RBR89_06890, partial [Candidatus Bipolaricaulis sp.]|nr:hypothetical protein [Candidatus Bipolaricaulis sp.]